MITKQELQKLLDNVDENELNMYKIDFCIFGNTTRGEYIRAILENCQKKLTLEDELLKIGYKKYKNCNNGEEYLNKSNNITLTITKNDLYYELNSFVLSQINNIEKFTINQIITWVKNMENLTNDMENNNG